MSKQFALTRFLDTKQEFNYVTTTGIKDALWSLDEEVKLMNDALDVLPIKVVAYADDGTVASKVIGDILWFWEFLFQGILFEALQCPRQ